MSDEPFKKMGDSLWSFTALLVAIFVVWGISWIAVAYYLPDWQSRSAFGDMFGAINALFSGAAFAGVIFAILLQRRELMLQRRELEMTREELSRSAGAQERAEKALSEQANLMLLTAKLNAASSLLDAHMKQVELYHWQGVSAGGRIFLEASSKLDELTKELNDVVKEVKDTYRAT